MDDFASVLAAARSEGAFDAKYDLDGDGSVTMADAVLALKLQDGGVDLARLTTATGWSVSLDNISYNSRTKKSTFTGHVTNLGAAPIEPPFVVALESMLDPFRVLNEDVVSTSAAPIFILTQSLAPQTSIDFSLEMSGNQRFGGFAARVYVP